MNLPFIHMDIATLVETAGYLGLFIIVFAESGLFFGFFFPGDSLLFTAGLLASQGYFSITYLVILLAIAAISGDSVGYWFGKKVGPRIFTREDSFFFHKKHIERAHEFYTKYGPRALVLARFVPVVRTFVPIVAGVGEMHYPTFLRYNIIGGLLWSVGVSLLGYFLGATVPNIEEYLLPIIIVIILLSVLPVVFDLLRARRHV
ncbi:MAG TPA: DedA family protein [Candidatus Paceibacterota bacterium]